MSSDAVIIANALHIIPNPEKALYGAPLWRFPVSALICTSCEWFYVKLGGGESSFALLTDFIKAHDLPMRLCGLCWCLFGLLFLISVLTKKTVFPRWCAIFNIIFFFY